jgi:hypothetical protein
MAAKAVENEMIELGVYALVVRGEGHDWLMGKNVKHYLTVPGLETLLHSFILDLDAEFSYIYKRDIEGYLKALQNKFRLDLMSLSENLMANIANMIDMESDDVMIYYLVITKTLEFLRQQTFDAQFWKIFEKVYSEFTKTQLTEKIKTRIQKFDDEGDETLSLMYNLIFIQFLAEIYQDKKLQSQIGSLIREKLKGLIRDKLMKN